MNEKLVLVVDDDKKNLAIVRTFLAADGYDVELSETLKQKPETKDIPILGMSAYHEYASGAPRADLAADAFLKKPFTRENLLRTVRELIGGGPRV